MSNSMSVTRRLLLRLRGLSTRHRIHRLIRCLHSPFHLELLYRPYHKSESTLRAQMKSAEAERPILQLHMKHWLNSLTFLLKSSPRTS